MKQNIFNRDSRGDRSPKEILHASYIKILRFKPLQKWIAHLVYLALIQIFRFAKCTRQKLHSCSLYTYLGVIEKYHVKKLARTFLFHDDNNDEYMGIFLVDIFFHLTGQIDRQIDRQESTCMSRFLGFYDKLKLHV